VDNVKLIYTGNSQEYHRYRPAGRAAGKGSGI